MTRFALMPLILAAILLGACGRDRAGVENQEPTAAHQVGPATAGHLPSIRAPQSYTADDLWKAINGAADGFLAYGVQDVVIANYSQAGTGSEAAVEIYQMKDALNAYGKYSEERNPDNRFIDVGNEGYSGGTTVNFWKGTYFDAGVPRNRQGAGALHGVRCLQGRLPP